MAIYEDNVFVPEVALVVMERMMKRPEHFSILSYTMDGERSAVINRFSKGFQVGKGVLPVVRSLYSRIGTLPQYTLSSKDISSEAVAVRETILKAKSPERLLFTDLPLTLGFEPFNSFENNVSDRDKVTGFFNSLNNVFQEYINCYPALLIRIKKGLLQIFDVNDSDEWKKQVYNRALKLQGIVQDSKLRVLMVRAQDVQLGEKEYLESIGAGVVGQVPNRWNKADEDNFWRIVPDLTNQILAAESTQQLNSVLEDDQDGYLISISDKTGQVNRRVIRFSAQEKDKVVRYARKMLLQKSVDFDERLLLAALTEAARQLTT
jgi:hypothetical protein